MQYMTNSGIWGSVFAVPTAVVDRHLKLAGSVQLKALLWVLRQGGASFSDTELADALGVSPADARDALSYWQETGVLQFSAAAQKETPAQPQSPPSPVPAKETAPVVSQPPKQLFPPLPRPERPDPVFVSKRLEEDESLHCMMLDAEQILGRTLSSSDLSALLLIHDNYGLPVDVIIMLIQYAASSGKGNMRYIEKVALNWADEGITTHVQAEERLQQLTNLNRAWSTIQKAMGLPKRAPTEREKKYADSWVLQWHFSPDMLKIAYDRCVDAIGSFRAGYINKILERWHREGIAAPEQAAAENDRHRQTRSEEEKPSFDLDAYERDSMLKFTGGNR
ncbi:MAG: DnaD domain protein [Oscillospiraceae bacterium]|nr:DnaD domain protein [Oscillospiraceae bacterium]